MFSRRLRWVIPSASPVYCTILSFARFMMITALSPLFTISSKFPRVSHCSILGSRRSGCLVSCNIIAIDGLNVDKGLGYIIAWVPKL